MKQSKEQGIYFQNLSCYMGEKLNLQESKYQIVVIYILKLFLPADYIKRAKLLYARLN